MTGLPSYRKIWNISYPIILSLLAQNIITVIDTAFLGRVGEVELGASAIGGLFYFSLFMLGFGFATGAQILMARRNGEKDYPAIGRIFDHTMYIFITMSGVLIILILLFSPIFLRFFISSKEICNASIQYLDFRMWGILFAFTNVAFRAFFVGITKTKLLGYSALIMAIVNIVLDYLLIFGNFGFPEMGIAGAALASVIAEGASALFFIIAAFSHRFNKKYQIFKLPKFNKEIIIRTWNISVFIMLQNFVSVAGWFLFFLVIERTGERPLAISNIVRSLYMLLMIHIWSFSTSVNTLVSNIIGEGKPQLVFPIISRVNKLSLMITILVMIVSVVFSGYLIRVYTDDPALIAGARPVLFVVTGVLLPLSISNNWFNGVSGTGNTKIALFIEIGSIVLYVAYIFILTFALKASLPAIWTSEYVYIVTIGIFSYLYLKFGKWEGKKV